MTKHRTGTREEWLSARTELLTREKELTRQGDKLTRVRQELPWVRLDKNYFDTDEGRAPMVDLFVGRSQPESVKGFETRAGLFVLDVGFS